METALKELTALAHRLKDNPLLNVRLQHAAYHLRKQSLLASHAVQFILNGADNIPQKKLCDHVVSKAQQFRRLMSNAKEEAIHTASLKLQHGSTVVANHSDLVDAFLASKKVHIHSAAHSRAKNATVHDDHLIHNAIKHADFVLLGNAAITPQGVIVTEGAGLLAELAQAQGIPAYIAATGLDYSKFAVPNNKGHELLPPSKLTGIISELGVYAHAQFVKAAEQAYPFTSS